MRERKGWRAQEKKNKDRVDYNQLNGILKLFRPSSSHIALVIHPSLDLSNTEAVMPAPINTPCCRKAES